MRFSLLLVLFTYLSVQALAQENPAPEELQPGALLLQPGDVLWEEQREGALSAEDDTLAGGSHYDAYSFELEAGQAVEVSLTSTAFDTYLVVTSPSKPPQQNDDFGSSSESRLLWVAEKAGPLEVQVSSAEGGAVGTYVLVLRALTAEGQDRAERRWEALREAERLYKDVISLYEAGQYQEAEPPAHQTLTLREAALGSEHLLVAQSMDIVGVLLLEQGNYLMAEPLFEQSIMISEIALGAKHPDTAVRIGSLASLLRVQGKYEASRSLYMQALEISETALGPTHPDVAWGMNDLAGLLQDEGNYTAARPLFERSLSIFEAILNPEDPDLSYGYNNLALLLLEVGDYASARPLFERALAISETALGSEHPRVAAGLNNLAGLLQAQGKYSEARRHFEQALAIREAALGPGHPRVATSSENIAVLFYIQKDYAAAQPLLVRALRIREATLGSEHPAVAQTLNKLASNIQAQGGHREAIPLYERALSIQEEAVGPEHPDVAVTLHNLAGLFHNEGDYADAQPLYERALSIFNASPAYPHRRVEALIDYARLRKAMGDPRGALLDLEEGLRSAEALRPQTSGSEETRAGLFGRYDGAFDTMVAWQLEASDIAAAFEWAERGRARALLDQLAAGQVDLRAAIPTDLRAEIEAQETHARARLAELQARITFTRSRGDVPEPDRLATLAALEDSLRQADRDYANAYEAVKAASPLWRSYVTSGGEPVRLSESQRALVPPGGLLLLYQLSEESGSLFVIPPGRDGVEVFALAVPEEAAASLGVEAGPLTEAKLHAALAGEAQRDGLVTRLSTRGTEAGGPTSEAALHALWQVLLPETVWERVAVASEVIVVPDGPLHALPFEALVVEPGSSPTAVRYWLDAGPPVRYAPSATALYNIVRRPAPRVVARAGAPGAVSLSAVIYDPAEVLAAREEAPINSSDLFATTTPHRTRDAYVTGRRRAGSAPRHGAGDAGDPDGLRLRLGLGRGGAPRD